MKRRIFVALPLSRSLQKTVRRWQKDHTRLPVRWIKPENLHLTLIPPWWVADPTPVWHLLEGDTFKRCHLFDGLALTLERVAFGPTPQRPRLIWAMGKTSPKLIKLKKQLEETLRRPAAKRPFKPHLTLARFRAGDFPRFPGPTLEEEIDWREKVKSFALLESHLSPTGVTYEKLAVFPLQV